MTNSHNWPGLSGKTCVMTGGAGILGRSISEGLALAGVRMAILDLRKDAAEGWAQQLTRETGTECIGLQANVLEKESLIEASHRIRERFGVPDFLINAAGGNSPAATTQAETWQVKSEGPQQASNFFDIGMEGFRFAFDLNIIGTVLPSQVFGEMMAKRRSGVILNISSMNSFRPLTRIPAYSAAKASINNFTQWLATHLAPAGIRVNAIAPGFFLTDQNRFLLTDAETGEPTARGKKILANTPMGRYGNPQDLQGAVLFLLSESACFVTGVILPVDGGYSAYGGV